MRKVEGTVSSGITGLPVLHAQVRVLKADTTPAQLYSDNGVTPLDQPVLTNGLGYWSFFIADGTYTRIIANPDGSNPITFLNEEMYEDARNVSVPVGEAAVSLPSVGARMGRVLGFDSVGLPLAVANDAVAVADDVARAEAAATRADSDSAIATGAAGTASAASASAVMAAATVGVYQNSAATNIPRGAALNVTTPGSGGTNGTNYIATYTGGNYTGNPTILYDVVAGAVANVRLTDPGLYIGASPTAPTVVLGSGAGGAALTLTNVFRIGTGSGYWVQSTDGNTLDRYKNVAGAATSDTANVKSVPTATYLASAITSLNTVTQNSALHDERRTGFLRIVEGSGWVPNANGTVNAPAATGVQWNVETLPVSWAADKVAGRPINFSIDIVSGVLDAFCQIEQYNAINRGGSMIGSPVAMAVVTDGRASTITLDPACLSMRIVAYSTAGAVIYPFGGASLYPARTSRDAALLAAEGMARSLLDTVVPVTITDTNLSGAAGSIAYNFINLTVPATSSGVVRFCAKGAFVDGDSGVFTFQSTLPLDGVNQGIITVYDPSGGHGQSGSIPLPSIVQYAEGCYAAPFQVQSPGGEAFFGISITLNNGAAGLTRVLSNFQIWKGISTPPPLTKVPAMLADFISKQARFEASSLAVSRFPITCIGDSETQYNGDQKNWPQWLATMVRDRAEVRPRGVPGEIADDMLLRGGFKDCTVTGVVGGAIPAATTPVAITGFDIRPGSPFSIPSAFARSNPDAYPLVYLENVLGRIWCDSFDASNPPMPNANSVFFQRLTAGDAVPVTSSSKLIWQDGLVSIRHKIICMGTYNSAASTRTCADTMFARKLALDGSYKNMLFIPYAVALATSPTNSYYASMAAAYPGQVLDVNYAPTLGEQAILTAKFGTVWTAGATVSEMAAGYIPQILKWDNVHFMEPGAYLIAMRVYTWVLANWMTP